MKLPLFSLGLPRLSTLAAAILLPLALGGCQTGPGLFDPPASLTLTGRGTIHRAQNFLDSDEHPTVSLIFTHAYYAWEGKQNIVLVMVDGTDEAPTSATTIRVLWRPEAGSTPIDENASNASMHVMRFQSGHTEVWSGAGFVYFTGTPGKTDLSAECWGADVVLQDASANVADSLGPARAEGSCVATYNPDKVAQLLRALSRKASAGLDYPCLVRK